MANGQASKTLLVSSRTDRGNAVGLDGTTQHGKVAIFFGPTATIDGATVRFSIDGKVRSSEGLIAYDLATTAPNGTARLLDLNTLQKGRHTVTADILLPSGVSITHTATFIIT